MRINEATYERPCEPVSTSTCSHSLNVEHSLVLYSVLFQGLSRLAGIHDFLTLPHSL